MIDQDEQKLILGEDYFLEHYGKKGMKWGQRRQTKRIARQQKAINRLSRVASGKGSKADKFIASTLQLPLGRIIAGKGVVGGSKRTLDRLQANQAKINAGKMKATSILAKAYGVEIRSLDYSYKK